MGNDVLSEVIKAEKEIQEKIEDEKKRAMDSIAEAQKEADDEIAREEERLKAALSAAAAEARKDAAKKAEEIRTSAGLLARRLGSLTDEHLRGMLMAPLLNIVPRRHDDSQDVQG